MRRIGLALIAWMLALLALSGALAETEEGAVDMFNNVDMKRSLPLSYDLELAAEKGLADKNGFSQRYFELQAYYARAIWELLEAKCGISQLDAQILGAELRFIPCAEPVNVYQKHWSFGAKFLFLRNNLHLERLSPEELNELDGYERAAEPADEVVQGFVQKTLQGVICIYTNDALKDADAVYEMDGTSAPNRAIVVGIATMPEYDAQGGYVDAEHESIKYEAISAIAEQAGKTMTEALGIPVACFVY